VPHRNAGFITDVGGKIAKMDEGAYPSLPPPTTDKTVTAADVFNNAKGAVGIVSVEGSMEGSGNDGEILKNVGTLVVVTPSGYALMTKHLLDGLAPKTIKVSANVGGASAPMIPVDIIKSDGDLDISLVKLRDNKEYPGIKFSREQALIGDQVYILGYPVGTDLYISESNITTLTEKRGGFGIDAALGPGFSGSPVFNRKGEIIGLVLGGREGGGTIVEPIQPAFAG
jgi:S1-C subfamily serine protease